MKFLENMRRVCDNISNVEEKGDESKYGEVILIKDFEFLFHFLCLFVKFIELDFEIQISH